ncbi:hypothetical protein D3C87_1309820 [compost metagenome]
MQRRAVLCGGGNGNDVFRAKHAEFEGLRIKQHRHFGVGVGQKEIALPVHQRIEVLLHAAGIRPQNRKQRSRLLVHPFQPVREEGERQRVQRRQPHCSGILTVFLQQGATGVVKLLQGFLRHRNELHPGLGQP